METVGERQCSELWSEFEPRIRSLCKVKLHSCPDEIDDVVSEIFLALCRRVSESGPPENPKAWLYGTANNLICMKYREIYKDRERTESLSCREYGLAFTNDFSEEIENRRFLEQLGQKLEDGLSEEEALLFKLIYEDEMKLKEAAKVMNITEAAAKQRHYRLCNKIRKTAKEMF